MKQFKKSILAITLVATLLLSNTLLISAATKQSVASYDLDRGGIQTFYLQDSNGMEMIITIEELNDVSRISNGSYKVSYDYPNKWKAGFTIDVSSNKITRAYSAFHTAVLGSITNTSLTLNSSIKATYKFIHKYGLISTTTGVIATISGTSLNISKL